VRLAADISNKQLRQPPGGGPSAWGLGEGLIIAPHHKEVSLLRNVIQGLGLDGLFGTT
jgi:hypothetical protein